jgi:hypothetical protein
LIRRCNEADLKGTQADLAAQIIRIYTLLDGRQMALISWRTLLNYIQVRLEAEGDRRTLGDLTQLMGLCEHMDSTAFIPLTSEDLTNSLYKRVLQFSDIVDDIVRILVDRGEADTKGLTAVSTKGVYGRYLRFRGVGCHLACDVRRWTLLAPTPLWLTVGQQFMGGCPPRVHEALAPLSSSTPQRLFIVDKGLPTIPLYVPAQTTRDQVLAAILKQLDDLGRMIPPETASPD